METTGTRAWRAPYGNQRQQIQVRSRWDHSQKVQVRRRWQQDSPSPGEAQVAFSHQMQVRTSQGPDSPGPGEAQGVTSVTR